VSGDGQKCRAEGACFVCFESAQDLCHGRAAVGSRERDHKRLEKQAEGEPLQESGRPLHRTRSRCDDAASKSPDARSLLHRSEEMAMLQQIDIASRNSVPPRSPRSSGIQPFLISEGVARRAPHRRVWPKAFCDLGQTSDPPCGEDLVVGDRSRMLFHTN
jgi:hypothetical protein